MVLYPNKLPESERVCSGICTRFIYSLDELNEMFKSQNNCIGLKPARILPTP